MGPRLRPGADGIKAASIILSGVSIGTVAGVPAGAMLGHLLGWRWSFACAAGMALLVLGALAIWLPPVKPDAGRGIKQLAALMNVRPLRAALIATLTMFVGQFGTYTYIAPFLNQVAHVDGKAISAVLLGYGVASFFGNLLGGWACAKNIRLAVVATGLVTGCALLCLAVVGTQPFWAIACVLLWGVGFGMLPISFQSWVFDASPESMDNTGSLFVATAQVAIATGSLMGGASVDHLGLVATMLSGGALSVITGMVLVRTMLFRRGARLPLASLRSER
jgi:predicted MFS family arabinose efflux permease